MTFKRRKTNRTGRVNTDKLPAMRTTISKSNRSPSRLDPRVQLAPRPNITRLNNKERPVQKINSEDNPKKKGGSGLLRTTTRKMEINVIAAASS